MNMSLQKCPLFLGTYWQGFPDTSYIGERGQPRATGVESTYIKADLALGTYPNQAFKGSHVALLFSLNLV